jgi:hypothetical protein
MTRPAKVDPARRRHELADIVRRAEDDLAGLELAYQAARTPIVAARAQALLELWQLDHPFTEVKP